MKKVEDVILRVLGSRTALAATALIIILMLTCVLVISCTHAEDTGQSTEMFVLVPEGEILNVRYNPKPHSDIVLKLDRGESVKVYGISDDGWADIGRAGDPGYCRIEYLTSTPPTEPADYITTVGKVNVRKVPGGKPVRSLGKGETVSVIGWVTDADGTEWANIGDGFVMKKFLEVAP